MRLLPRQVIANKNKIHPTFGERICEFASLRSQLTVNDTLKHHAGNTSNIFVVDANEDAKTKTTQATNARTYKKTSNAYLLYSM